jgi:ubiquinone/menaquinone biosynthesis C-methylase UbiE
MLTQESPITTTSNLGTYSFNEFSHQNRELQRLEEQATLFWQQESQVLLDHGLKQATRILDLACGPGFITQRIHDEVPEAKITGVDLNATLLKVAKSNVNSSQSKVQFVEADCTKLPFEDHSFDFIYARLLFQHLKDPDAAVREIRRVLVPGGRVLLMDVDDRDLAVSPENPAFMEFARTAEHYQSQAGGNRRVGRELTRLLQSHDFRDTRHQMQTVHSGQIGLETFFRITTEFKSEQLPREQVTKTQERLATIYNELKNAQAEISAGIHIATGRA